MTNRFVCTDAIKGQYSETRHAPYRSCFCLVSAALFGLGGDGVFEIEDENAVVVELAVVKASGFVDLDPEFAGKPVTADALSAGTPARTGRVRVLFHTQPCRP